MSKGQITKEHIVQQAATLFNTRGYSGGSMSELMALTGLQKGGIYNHFQTKEEIAVEAFDYAINRVSEELRNVTRDKSTATEKLKAIINFYRDYPLDSTIEGGCPILNTSVEADDTNPALRRPVQKAFTDLINALVAIINKGVKNGEFRDDVKPQKAAVIIIALIEGGILMTRALDDSRYMHTVTDQLLHYIDRELSV